MNSIAIKTALAGLLLIPALSAQADNSDTPLTKTYGMNTYVLLCKNWKQGKPLQIVEVINKQKGTETFYLEDQIEGGGEISIGLDAMAQGPFDDSDINKEISVFLKEKRSYKSIDAARAAACSDK